MRLKILVAVWSLTLTALAQTAVSPRAGSPADPMTWLQSPPAIFGEWWKNPEIANELRLTDAQKKQLDQASTNMKLTLIDAGATGLKSYVQLSSLLDAEQLNEAAYSQQLDQVASAASKLVKDVGQMALTVRRTLTADQWHKLEGMQQAGRFRQPPPGAAPARPREPMRPVPPPGD